MRMREIDYGGARPVDGYGPGGFRIAGAWHGGAVLVGPGGVAPVPAPPDPAAAAAVLAIAGEVDLVLIGLGAEMLVRPAALAGALEAAGLAVEAMTTPPACRSYNMLLAEGRRVAALLAPVGAPG